MWVYIFKDHHSAHHTGLEETIAVSLGNLVKKKLVEFDEKKKILELKKQLSFKVSPYLVLQICFFAEWIRGLNVANANVAWSSRLPIIMKKLSDSGAL